MKEVNFCFSYQCGQVNAKLTVPIVVPFEDNIKELVHRLIAKHNLPCFVEKELRHELELFVKSQNKQSFEENGDHFVEKLQKEEIDNSKILQFWNEAFQKHCRYTETSLATSSDEEFSDIYHSLIHSHNLETLLNLEQSYAFSVQDLNQERDKDLADLEKRQQREMDEILQNIGKKYSDDDVNRKAQKHIDNHQFLETKWASQISMLQDTQKRGYRDWLNRIRSDPASAEKELRRKARANTNDFDAVPDIGEIRLEESFTVQLGAQLKTTHNIRLIREDVLAFCKVKPIQKESFLNPQHIQTAMSLYSSQLCGLVLVVDNRLSSYTGIKKDFASACQQSTELHFTDLSVQFSDIEECVKEASEWQMKQPVSPVSMNGSSTNPFRREGMNGAKMKTGDFYLTRHSNLAEVHVVYHLVGDEQLQLAEINSRHPAIAGLRNILKACCSHDVTTLTIPLLLIHEITEEITLPWVQKRAELVFKCMKGFMMEMVSWGCSESRTIQFVVPKGLSSEAFYDLIAMLPNIFRVARTKILKNPTP